jgi:hypothetical protein
VDDEGPGGPVDEEVSKRPRRRFGATMAVPAVLTVVVALLLVGVLRQGEESAPSPSPVPVVPTASSFLYCSDCHADLDKSFNAGEHPTLLFTHEQHFTIGVSDCAACHVANTHEPDRTNRPTMVTCFQCHSLEEGARAPGECTLCHPAEMNPEPKTHFTDAWLPQEHSEAAIANPFDCATCHKQEFCNECHGLELPHPKGFTDLTHAKLFFEDAALCDRCHPRQPLVERDTCDSCHHPEGPKASTWIGWHPSVVRESGAENCFQCHATETCRTCHRRGPENFTNDDLAADEALLTALPEPSVTGEPSPSGG